MSEQPFFDILSEIKDDADRAIQRELEALVEANLAKIKQYCKMAAEGACDTLSCNDAFNHSICRLPDSIDAGYFWNSMASRLGLKLRSKQRKVCFDWDDHCYVTDYYLCWNPAGMTKIFVIPWEWEHEKKNLPIKPLPTKKSLLGSLRNFFSPRCEDPEFINK